MTKAITLSLACVCLLALSLTAVAQSSAQNEAVQRALINQQNVILLRQKLGDAKAAEQRHDTVGAAKLYQEAFELTVNIGPGVEAETKLAKEGLATTRLALARAAQGHGDYNEAGKQVIQVLHADPKNAQAIAFKKQNDQMITAMKGQKPSAAVMEQVPNFISQKQDAGTLLQDGIILFQAGKLEDAETKLKAALALDPDNSGAYSYLALIKQSKLLRSSAQHSVDTQDRMEQVEKRWVLPTSKATLPPFGNPYATNTLTYTGPGRQIIVDKLNRIRIENFSYDGVPLSVVLNELQKKTQLADPDRKGINFLINPNADQSGPAIAGGGGLGGLGGFGGPAPAPAGIPPAVDPATGLPIAAPAGGATGGGEVLDAGQFTVKLTLSDVRLADVLAAIMEVAQNPTPGDQRTIKYSIKDYGIVFQAKAAESPQLFIREFKVDPNTFYSGLESVGALSFGGSGSSGGGGGGGGGRGGGGGGGGGQQGGGAVVGIVNPFAGGSGLRSQGGGGGGGGGGGSGQGAGNPLNAGGAAGAGGGGGGNQNNGGLNYITQITLASQVSAAARAYFTALGVNLDQPAGKAVFFNDKSGKLLVRATEQDLDIIEQAIHSLNEVAPQVHIKTRFIEVQQTDGKSLGFDWYLGNFVHDNVLANGGSAPSLNVPTSVANPLGAFPGNSAANIIAPSPNDQLLTGGLRNAGPALATVTGILTDPNFRVVLHALEQRDGFENLGEPEVTTTSGRQTQMRATDIIQVLTGFDTSSSGGGINSGGGGGGGGGTGGGQ